MLLASVVFDGENFKSFANGSGNDLKTEQPVDITIAAAAANALLLNIKRLMFDINLQLVVELQYCILIIAINSYMKTK